MESLKGLLSRLFTNQANSQLKDTKLLPITDPLLKTAQELLKSNGGELNFQVKENKEFNLDLKYPLEKSSEI
jgi:hypothetical protein